MTELKTPWDEEITLLSFRIKEAVGLKADRLWRKRHEALSRVAGYRLGYAEAEAQYADLMAAVTAAQYIMPMGQPETHRLQAALEQITGTSTPATDKVTAIIRDREA